MHPVYTKKLGLSVQKIDVDVQKIYNSALVTFEMVIAVFLVNDKEEKIRFFMKIFLLANINLDVILRILYLTSIKADIRFLEWQLL